LIKSLSISKDSNIRVEDLLEPIQYLNSTPEISQETARVIDNFLTTISQKEFCKPETAFDRAVVEGLTLNLNKLAETNPSLQKSCEACNLAMEELLKTDLQKAKKSVLELKEVGIKKLKNLISGITIPIKDFAKDTAIATGKVFALPKKQALQVMAVCSGLLNVGQGKK